MGRNSRVLRNTLLFFGSLGTVILSIAIFRYFKRIRLVRENERVRLNLEEIVRARQERNHNTGTTNSNLQENSTGSFNQEETEIDQSQISNNRETDPFGVSPQTCIVCLNEQREVILMNCGHVCVCAGCAMQIMTARPICPVCRADIVHVAPAFIA